MEEAKGVVSEEDDSEDRGLLKEEYFQQLN